MTLDFTAIFRGGRIPDWLQAFATNPDAALHDVLLNRAELGHLAVADPVELLLGWLRRFQQQTAFSAQLDASLATWIRQNWGLFELEGGANSATLTTAAWIRASELLAASPGLTQAGDLLSQYVIDDPRYLNSLCEGRSRDPQASALLALASHQRDRNLLSTWWQLCEIPPDQPWYRGHCAIAGLRALPAKSTALKGVFSKEVAEGLNRFGLALLRLQEQGWLTPELAAEEFQDSLRLCMLAYPFPDRWMSFWRHVLWRDQRQGDLMPWLKPQLPKLAKLNAKALQPKKWANFDSAWPQRAKDIAALLRKNSQEAEHAANQLLDEQARYKEASGDSNNLARAATQLSKAARENRPELALKWAQLAKKAAPWDSFGWTNEVSSLQALGDLQAALTAALETKARFPENVVARAGLAEVLKSLGRLDEAEAEYRETKARFPDNAVARNGLAEVLKSLGRLDEAEAEYRETKARFPDNVISRNGLAEVLKSLDQLHEAEAEYRETKARFPDNAISRNGLAEVLKSLGRLDEAEAEYRETKARFPNDVVARTGLAEVLKSLGRLDEAEAEYRETKTQFPGDVVAQTGLAGVFLAQDCLEEAELAYREALKLAPNNAIATAGLARVLHPLGRADEIEELDEIIEPDEAATDVLTNPNAVNTAISELGTPADNPQEQQFGYTEPFEEMLIDVSSSQNTLSTRVSEAGTTPADNQQLGNIKPEENQPDEGLSRREIETLTTDAYLIRGWARTSDAYDPNLPQGKFREKAEALLTQLLPSVDRDPLAAGELALLNLERGDIEQVLVLLRRAVQHFPGSARVRYALARAERQAGQGNPVTSFRRLLRMDAHFEPIYYLGASRALLAPAKQQDQTAEEKAREHLGRLGYWISQRIEPRPDRDVNNLNANPRECFQAKKDGGFDAWWALETHAEVFGMHQVRGYDDLVDFESIKKRIASRPLILNQLEEDVIRRRAVC